MIMIYPSVFMNIVEINPNLGLMRNMAELTGTLVSFSSRA
jgi:hypothetical protein